MNAYTWVDVLLALGFTLRLIQLVTRDDIAVWWVHQPLLRLGQRKGTWNEMHTPLGLERVFEFPRWFKYAQGLECMWCVGFWLGALVLLSLKIAGGPGHAWEIWRWTAGAFALNYVAAVLQMRLSPKS